MLFLTGPHGAGKTTTAMFLKKHGFVYVDLGPCLRAVQKCTCPNKTFLEWCLLGEKKFGKTFTDEITAVIINIAFSYFKNSDHHFLDLAVVGSRSYSNINFIRHHIKYARLHKKIIIIYITATPELLRKRYNIKECFYLSRNAFGLLLKKDLGTGLNQIKDRANYIISNNGTRVCFYKEIQKIVCDNFKSTKKIHCKNLDPQMVGEIFAKKYRNLSRLT